MTESTTPTAFCQNCGKPLTPATTRTVGPATYCEPCLEARLHGQPPIVPPATSAGRNPGTAALLGLIPGVGAMYNEQYGKGIVHLIVFAVLIVLADSVNGIFGLFIAGWCCYMVIEAHHTARARRDFSPLPNPFGLNDIGERLGFGKAWPAGAPNVSAVFHDAATAAAHAAQQFTTQHHPSHPFTQPPPPQAQPMPNQPMSDPFQTAPASSYGDWSHQQPAQPFANPGTQQPWSETYTPQNFVPPPIPVITGHHRFPAGAVWLIGAGIFFLLATTGIFHAFNGNVLVGVGLIALAVWLFLRCLLNSGPNLSSDGSPAYNLRVLRALQRSAWVGLTGALILLNTLHILRWSHSWPLYLILAGVMGFLQRSAQQHAALYPPPSGPRL